LFLLIRRGAGFLPEAAALILQSAVTKPPKALRKKLRIFSELKTGAVPLPYDNVL
jgi:hypothetical protein